MNHQRSRRASTSPREPVQTSAPLHPLVKDVSDAIIESARQIFVEQDDYDAWAKQRNITRIGIHGFKRHGKDTLATAILDHLYDAKRPGIRRGIADPLKLWCSSTLGLPERTPWFWGNDDERETPRQELGGLSGRALLQQVASEGVRMRWRTDAWVGLFRRGLVDDNPDPGTVIVIPDIRFEDEATELTRRRAHGDRLVEIIRADIPSPTDKHISERGLPKHITRDRVRICSSLNDVDDYAKQIVDALRH